MNTPPKPPRRANDMHRSRTRFQARIDDDVYDIFAEIAKEQNVSVNRLLNDVMEEYVDNYTK